ncbi:MAG: IS256 family transposase [Anaerolineales bacterium]
MESLERKRRKSKRLGRPEGWNLANIQAMEIDTRIELIRSLIPLGLMHVQEGLEEEVQALAGARHQRGREHFRHGSNPGSVKLQGRRHPVRVPRVRSRAGEEVSLRCWEALRRTGDPDEILLRRVLYGISCRNYEPAAEAVPGAIGISASSVSRTFIEASAAQLRAFQEQSLAGLDLAALFIDGKTFAEDTMVIALGVDMDGRKIPLGFIQTGTENQRALTPFLQGLLERGLDISRGLLVIIDGAKGLRAAVDKAFAKKALVQRCQWHKRENVVSYLPKGEQERWRRRLQRAYERPTYAEAKSTLLRLRSELSQMNESAAASLDEGFEETLTLHRLGVFALLGRSLKTTNCLESINSLVEERCAKVDYWKNSNQKMRWLVAALLDIQPRLRRIKGYRHLPLLRQALVKEIVVESGSQDEAA